MVFMKRSSRVHTKERLPWRNEPSVRRIFNDIEDRGKKCITPYWGSIME